MPTVVIPLNDDFVAYLLGYMYLCLQYNEYNLNTDVEQSTNNDE